MIGAPKNKKFIITWKIKNKQSTPMILMPQNLILMKLKAVQVVYALHKWGRTEDTFGDEIGQNEPENDLFKLVGCQSNPPRLQIGTNMTHWLKLSKKSRGFEGVRALREQKLSRV
jgi:hypothetical protein